MGLANILSGKLFGPEQFMKQKCPSFSPCWGSPARYPLVRYDANPSPKKGVCIRESFGNQIVTITHHQERHIASAKGALNQYASLANLQRIELWQTTLPPRAQMAISGWRQTLSLLLSSCLVSLVKAQPPIRMSLNIQLLKLVCLTSRVVLAKMVSFTLNQLQKGYP